jgi:lactate dehydrogenase-like 2-hydroxyacid dehydrogenase
VSGKRLGIFGMGRIGREIAARAQGFKMSFAYTDLQRMEDLPYDFFESAETMAANVDFFVVSAAACSTAYSLPSSICRRSYRSPT